MIKYDASGAQQWVARNNEPVYHPNVVSGICRGIAVDASGNVYVTASTYQGSSTGFDFTTIKYNSAGAEQWVARYAGPGNAEDNPVALVIDGSRNIYVAGPSLVRGQDSKLYYIMVKYDLSGRQQWVAQYPGQFGPVWNELYALAVDGSGNVHTTTSTLGSGTGLDFITLKYNSVGVEQWLARYNGPRNDDDFAEAMVIDRSGNVYVTGSGESYVPGQGVSSSSDYVTVKYNPSGVEQWIARHNGPEGAGDFASALAIDNAGNVYVTGASRGQNFSYSIYTTIKYAQTPVSVEEQKPNQPSGFWLSQNYPNPFNPTTTIRYEIPKPGHVTLKVFNLAGHEVATLVSEKEPAGEHEVEWNVGRLPSGVYVYRLRVGDLGESRKLVLMK